MRIAYEDMGTFLSDIRSLEKVISRTKIFWEQVTENLVEQRKMLADMVPKDAVRLRFPALTCASLWPFNIEDQRKPMAHESFYYYSDFVAIKLYRDIVASKRDVTDLSAVTDNELMHRYDELSAKYMPKMEQVWSKDVTQWKYRDTHSDVKISDFLEQNFISKRMFWTSGRPSWDALREIFYKLLDLSFGLRGDFSSIREAANLMEKGYKGNNLLSVPINPQIAKELELLWYDPDEKYQWLRHKFSFQQWIVRCIRNYPYIN
jgi:hypothetical protein